MTGFSNSCSQGSFLQAPRKLSDLMFPISREPMHKQTLTSFQRVLPLKLLGRNMSCQVKGAEVGHTRAAPAGGGDEGLMFAQGGKTPPHMQRGGTQILDIVFSV